MYTVFYTMMAFFLTRLRPLDGTKTFMRMDLNLRDFCLTLFFSELLSEGQKETDRKYWIRLNSVIEHFGLPIDTWEVQ